MQSMTVFRDDRFGEVRTATINGEPWFVGKDVAEMLGYSNPRKAIIDHVDTEDKVVDGVTIRDSIGREQKPILINESGLYSLILSSKLPQAKEFKRWVTSVILPALRRTGSYIAGEEHMDEDELIAQGYLALQRKLAARTAELGRANEVIAELAPKAAYYDAVAGSEGDKSFRETAKTFGVPEKKFIAFLIDHGYVYRDARGTLMPYADHMKRGQFTVREIVYNGAETIRTSSQTRITPKGRQVIWRAMEKDGLITLYG
jgi:prophage antirepressor-like protein